MNTAKIFTYLFMVFLLVSTVFAARDSSFVLNEDHGKNLYLTNSKIVTEANLYGDLYAVSNDIKVKSLVKDDVDAITNSFNLEGTIGSDLRLISGNANINGIVFGEVMILGSNVQISNKSMIGGPVNIKASTVVIDGTLKDDLFVEAEKVTLNGIVEGNAVIKSSVLELGPDAKVIGDFSSTRNIDEQASQIGGTITKIKGREDPSNFTSITLSKIGLFIMIFLIGTIMILSVRKHTERATKAMYSKFLFSMLIGFAAIIVVPIVAIILLFTVVGIPIAILLAAIYLILIILGLGAIALFLGRLNTKMVKGKTNLWLELLIGSLALALISIIPVIFALVLLLIGFVAVGALILTAIGKDKKK